MVDDDDRDGPAGAMRRGEFRGDQLSRRTAPAELEDEDNRRRWGLGESEDERGPYLIELNVQHVDGLAGAAAALVDLFETVIGAPTTGGTDPWGLVKISKTYLRCEMHLREWKTLVAADEAQAAAAARSSAGGSTGAAPDEFRFRTIYKLWPDFPVRAHITRSVATIKADAALRSFEATGEGITWAVIDSGVDASHPHFGDALSDPSVQNLHRCFIPVDNQPVPDPDEQPPRGRGLSKRERNRRTALHIQHSLHDGMGHGTHVAGIIAGQVPEGTSAVILEKEESIVAGDEHENLPQRRSMTHARTVNAGRERDRLHGVAPGCRIVSLRVLDDEGRGRSSNIVRALEYIREKLNDNPKMLRVHGVNLSVGYEFDAEMFACGQSPLCSEVNRLVQSGVVVVAAAGNTGYSTLSANGRVTKVGLQNTINDPGNAELALTVGSTHRHSPHAFGISYFSSKGPTGDGRLKPDLVAPGERILSCAAGAMKEKALEQVPDGTTERDEKAYYLEDSGTSMAAPHVSGAIAAFLSIRQEFIGRPLEVKRIFLGSAVPLGRERYFEGNGLVDLMKAIQSV